jgi:hypothetical protein
MGQRMEQHTCQLRMKNICGFPDNIECILLQVIALPVSAIPEVGDVRLALFPFRRIAALIGMFIDGDGTYRRIPNTTFELWIVLIARSG